MFFAYITLLIGLSISATAAYFSIIGLGQLFAASFWSVVIMGIVIEAGKIIAATWLHTNWRNSAISWFHKMYLIIAIIVAMTITGLGVFGYLSKAHLDQEAPVIEQLTAQHAIEKQITDLQLDLTNLQKNLDSINNISNTKNNRSLDSQRTRILKEMDADRKQIDQLNTELLQDKKETSKVTLQLGPAKYLADILFGDGSENIDKAVQIFIFLIMIVFDPLALTLVVSANASFKALRKDPILEPIKTIEPIKEKTKEIEVKEPVKPQPSIEEKPATKKTKQPASVHINRLTEW